MGRHASPDPDPVAAPEPATPVHRIVVWGERILLGLAAGVGILLVLRWAGTSWSAAAWTGLAIAVIVPAAAWLAATVPGREHRDR
ncbi:hypothetical protein ACPPVS_05995 [Cellulomonas sp. McL0617]|uniref:hypothetical protein n=1 Tax=Cellulomonas sp. McL0617 TaxID=3415675 RepID=UPI003CE6714A